MEGQFPRWYPRRLQTPTFWGCRDSQRARQSHVQRTRGERTALRVVRLLVISKRLGWYALSTSLIAYSSKSDEAPGEEDWPPCMMAKRARVFAKGRLHTEPCAPLALCAWMQRSHLTEQRPPPPCTGRRWACRAAQRGELHLMTKHEARTRRWPPCVAAAPTYLHTPLVDLYVGVSERTRIPRYSTHMCTCTRTPTDLCAVTCGHANTRHARVSDVSSQDLPSL